MQEIKKNIKEEQFHRLYLLYGAEDYLRHSLKQELKQALVGEDVSMNYAYYEGNKVEADEVIAFAKTMPFFAQWRLVIVENCAVNKKPTDAWLDFLGQIPDTAVVVLVEREIDKRGRFYKTCKKHAYMVDVDKEKGGYVQQWIKEWLTRNHGSMNRDVQKIFLERVSDNMALLERELEKLRDYKMKPEQLSNLEQLEGVVFEITVEDIEAVSVKTVENQIFEMIDAAAKQNASKAFMLYQDLLSLKESPIKILVLLHRQTNILLQIKDHIRLKHNTGEIASALKLPPFVINKNSAIAKQYSYKRLKDLFALGVQLDEDIKLGRIKDQIAIELLLSEYCNAR